MGLILESHVSIQIYTRFGFLRSVCTHKNVLRKGIYKWGVCWKRCLINLISLFVFLLSVNEVLLNDLGFTMMFWLRIDRLKNDEATSCLWLKISNGSMIISEWCCGFVYASMFILEWQLFSFMVQCFDIYMKLLLMDVSYTSGFLTVK